MVNEPGKSDRPTVPAKSPNNAGQPVTEGMEGRDLAKKGTCLSERVPDSEPEQRASALGRVRRSRKG